MKKFFSLIFALCCAMIVAASDIQLGGIWYNFDNNGNAEVTYRGVNVNSYNNEYSGAVVIPSSVAYNGRLYRVSSIGNGAFENCTGLSSVMIPNSVTYIGSYAFYGCTGLTSITIPDSVTFIGGYAFRNCTGLTEPVYNQHVFSYMPTSFSGSYTIPETIATIASAAFEGCTGLTSVNIPDQVTKIGSSAFRNCTGLTSIDIPNNVTESGTSVFSGCTGLTEPVYNQHVFFYMPTTFSGSYTIPETIATIAGNAFSGCNGLTSITIPNSMDSIGSDAFFNCRNLTNVVTNACTPPTMYSNAFSSSSTTLTVPLGKTNEYKSAYGWRDFREYLEPYEMTLVSSDELMGHVNPTYLCDSVLLSADAFTGYRFDQWSDGNTDNPRTVVVTTDTSFFAFFIRDLGGPCGNSLRWSYENNVLSFIGTGAMYDYAENNTPWALLRDSITSISIPDGVTYLGSYAFQGCTELTSVTIPNSITSSGNRIFSGCTGLVNPVFNRNVFFYMPESFVGSYSVSDGISTVSGGAFRACTGLTSIELPNSLTTLGSNAFQRCTGLKEIRLPENVTSLGARVFNRVDSLQDLYCYAQNPPEVKETTFEGMPFNVILHIYCEYEERYNSTPVWNQMPIFCITNGDPDEDVALEQLDVEHTAQKIFRNGHIFIQTADGQLFDATGRRVE